MAAQPDLLGLQNYSFGASSRTSPASYDHAAYRYPRCAQNDPTTDLALLADRFSQHSIRAETSEWEAQQQQYRHTTRHTASPPQQQNTSSCNITARRAQRQATTMLQCQASHVRQLSLLLEQMVASGEQCNVCRPARQPCIAESAWDEDETMGEMEEGEEEEHGDRSTLTYRRSADLSSQQGYVHRAIRVRKKRRGDSARSSR